ncbi:MAG: lipid II flippase MurJ [Pseudomonadota bacterium]|nr:lipid II flippase MurJ [Pseudomonadota bacterium]
MSIGRTTLLLAPVAVVARAVAFFVPVFIARWYGVQSATDAFYWALSVPTFLLILGSTTMGAVLVPVLATLRVAAPERVPGVIGASTTLAAGLALTLGATVATAAPWVLPHLTRFDAPTRALTVQFAWALVPFLMAVAVAAVLKAACEVHGRFAGPASAPVVRALTTLAVVGAFREQGAMVLPVGLLCGSLAEVTLLVVVLEAAGIRLRPSLALPPELADAARAFGPVLGGETMVALNLIVDKLFAGTGPEGSVSLLEYADRARMIPQTLLESTLMVVAFNAWAAARARGEDEGRHRAVAKALWWVCLLAPPVLAGMAIGREALVRLLYEGGAFSPEHTAVTSATLGAFLPGVLFSLLGALISKAHIVAGRYRLVLALGALSLGLNVVLDAALMPGLGLVGLAMATSITTAVVTLVSFTRLLPELRGVFPAAQAWTAVAMAVVSGALALLAVVRGFTPLSVTDPWLWIASVPFLGLLGAGALRVRRAS